MKKIIRRLYKIAVCVVMAAVLTVLPVGENASVIGVGSSRAAAQTSTSKTNLTNVTSKKVLRENLTIKKGETLFVKNGGSLYVMDGVTLTVKGTLKCANGGEIYARGTIDAKSGSTVTIGGKLKILSMGGMSLGGSMSVTSSGEVKGAGKLSVLNNFSDINCKGTVTAKIVPPEPITKDGVTTVGGVLIVNKKYTLPEDYGSGLKKSAYSALLKMREASGYKMTIVSGFRSYAKQVEVYDYWCEIDGAETAATYSSLPGHSEHQSGLSMDITSLNTSYANTAEGKWLAENCYKYGFIIRYPKGKDTITGYSYEPWHIRYLGISTAKLVHDSGLTLEEFLGVEG